MTSFHPPLLGAIEAGGTKFVLAVGTAYDDVQGQTLIPTSTPAETMDAVVKWFGTYEGLASIGVATFGPAGVDPGGSQWGFVTETTKPGWSNTDIAGPLSKSLAVPIGFDTDVNGAAIGEYRYGAAQGCEIAVYVTVGTGIGGGVIVSGKPIHGSGHPEMGHIHPYKPKEDADFGGVCPFHGDCLEGLASGPAILARWNKSLSELPADHPGHTLIAGYLAQFCHALQALYAPQVILLGGGVMQTPGLLDKIREQAHELSCGYFPVSARSVIQQPGLGTRSGIAGAFALAENAMLANEGRV